MRQWTGLNRKGASMCYVHVGIPEVHSLKTIWILLLFSESILQLCTALRVCNALLIGAEIFFFFIHVILSSPLCYPLKGSFPWASLGTRLNSWMSTVLPNTRNSNTCSKNIKVPSKSVKQTIFSKTLWLWELGQHDAQRQWFIEL